MALDTFATPINLTIDGKNGHETVVGASFAILLIVFVVFYGIISLA